MDQSDLIYDNNDDEEEKNEGDDLASYLMSSDTIQEIMRQKKTQKTKFESYWENDENDIDGWTKQEIDEDPCKQVLTWAENGQLSEIKLLFASRTGDSQFIEKLINYKDADGYTAMHRAAYSHQLDAAKYLISIEQQSNKVSLPVLNQLNARTEMGWSPLHSAAYWNCFRVVEYFLKLPGVDVNARTNSGQTALHLAAQQSTGRETILLLLTDLSIDFRIKNEQGETAKRIAERSCKYNKLFEMADENLTKLF